MSTRSPLRVEADVAEDAVLDPRPADLLQDGRARAVRAGDRVEQDLRSLRAVARGEVGAGVASASGCERVEELTTAWRQLVVRDAVLRDVEALRRPGPVEGHEFIDEPEAVGAMMGHRVRARRRRFRTQRTRAWGEHGRRSQWPRAASSRSRAPDPSSSRPRGRRRPARRCRRRGVSRFRARRRRRGCTPPLRRQEIDAVGAELVRELNLCAPFQVVHGRDAKEAPRAGRVQVVVSREAVVRVRRAEHRERPAVGLVGDRNLGVRATAIGTSRRRRRHGGCLCRPWRSRRSGRNRGRSPVSWRCRTTDTQR